MASWLSLGFHYNSKQNKKKTKAMHCPWHLRSLRNAHQMSCVQTRSLKHRDSASVLFHLCISLITPVSSAMVYNYDDVLLSMLFLFLMCSWTELNSHTLIVEHCIKITCWVGLTWGYMDSSCIIVFLFSNSDRQSQQRLLCNVFRL